MLKQRLGMPEAQEGTWGTGVGGEKQRSGGTAAVM